MDPFSISVGCVSLLGAVMTVSAKLYQISLTFRERQDELSILLKELDSFQRSINTFCGAGLADECPREIRPDLCKIILESKVLVEELARLVEQMCSNRVGSQIQWSLSVRNEMNRVRQSLESHKAAINIAISAASMAVTCAIKRDTSSMRSKIRRIPDLELRLNEIMLSVQNLVSAQRSPRILSPAMQMYLRETQHYAETVVGTDMGDNDNDDDDGLADDMDSLAKEIEAQVLPISPPARRHSQRETLVSDHTSTSSHSSDSHQHTHNSDEPMASPRPMRATSEQLPSRVDAHENWRGPQMQSFNHGAPHLSKSITCISPFKFQDMDDYIAENPAPPILRRFNAMSTLSRSHPDSTSMATEEDWSEASLRTIANHLTQLVTRGRAVVECWIARTNNDLRRPPACLTRMRYLEAQVLQFRDHAEMAPTHKKVGSCEPPLPSSTFLDLTNLGDCAYTYDVLRSRIRYACSRSAATDVEGSHSQEARIQVLAIAATLTWMMIHHGAALCALEGDAFPNLLRTAVHKAAGFGVKIALWRAEEQRTFEMAVSLGCLPALLGLARLLLGRDQYGNRFRAAQCLRLWEVRKRAAGSWNDEATVRNDWAWKAKYDPVGGTGKSARR